MAPVKYFVAQRPSDQLSRRSDRSDGTVSSATHLENRDLDRRTHPRGVPAAVGAQAGPGEPPVILERTVRRRPDLQGCPIAARCLGIREPTAGCGPVAEQLLDVDAAVGEQSSLRQDRQLEPAHLSH